MLIHVLDRVDAVLADRALLPEALAAEHRAAVRVDVEPPAARDAVGVTGLELDVLAAWANLGFVF